MKNILNLRLRALMFFHKYSLRHKCYLDKGSKISDPTLIVNHDKDRSKIVIGKNTHINGQLMAYPGGQIKIGDDCYLGVNSRIWSDTLITIKNRVLISHDVNIFDNQTHPFNPLERHRQHTHIIERGFPKDIDLSGEEIFIEDDVWIGCGVIVLKGVSIGKCSIIGAGSVVTKDVPSYKFAAGNPARIIRDISKECEYTVTNE